MVELVRSVEVAAPAEDPWRAAVDCDRQGEWMLGTTVRVTAAGGAGVGATMEAVTGRRPFEVVDQMEIVHWDPPRRCEVRHTGRTVRGAGAFEVVPLSPTTSRFVWSEWLEMPFGAAGVLGWTAVRPLAAAGVAWSLARFARWVPEHAAGEPG